MTILFCLIWLSLQIETRLKSAELFISIGSPRDNLAAGAGEGSTLFNFSQLVLSVGFNLDLLRAPANPPGNTLGLNLRESRSLPLSAFNERICKSMNCYFSLALKSSRTC